MELPVLESERLTLRPLTDADVETLLPAVYEPDYRQVALNIMLRPGFQDQGLGPDALRLLIRWFIDEHGHHRFTIDPSAENHRAIAAYERVGFKPVGILRKAERSPSGHWRDSLLMDLLDEDLN